LKGSTARAGLAIRALEDNDDNDDTAIGNCDWVLSFRDKHKLKNLAFKPAAATSTVLRVLIGARAKMGVGEDAADAAATAFCTTAASFRSFQSLKQRWLIGEESKKQLR
jgi:hypothetical protein